MSVKKYSDDVKGYTQLFGGDFITKSSILIEAYGVVDELNCLLGVVRSHTKDTEIIEILHKIQTDLFNLSADLASPITDKKTDMYITRITESDILWVEDIIIKIDKELPELRNFIFPTGCKAASFLQLARAVCRRAERRTFSMKEEKGVNQIIPKYLNRLSDFLFFLARYANKKENVDDVVWRKNG